MDFVSIKYFKENLTSIVERVVDSCTPLKVNIRAGSGVVIISAAEWRREQETLYVLQNSDLMQQIHEAKNTYKKSSH